MAPGTDADGSDSGNDGRTETDRTDLHPDSEGADYLKSVIDRGWAALD